MRYFLDTTFAIDYLRQRSTAVDRLERLLATGDDPFINDVVVCELATGALAGEERGLHAFIRAIEFVQPGHEVAELAGSWRRSARSRGFTLSVPDALIAATTSALGATLLTRNVRDFALTPVSVETY
jgi:predicted nucleic acid-binding protein